MGHVSPGAKKKQLIIYPTDPSLTSSFPSLTQHVYETVSYGILLCVSKARYKRRAIHWPVIIVQRIVRYRHRWLAATRCPTLRKVMLHIHITYSCIATIELLGPKSAALTWV